MLTPVSPMSPEGIRREMKSRFDAVNAEAEVRHQLRRDLGDSKEAKTYNRPLKPVGAIDELAGLGENDSSGG
jgi:hypothetical protein